MRNLILTLLIWTICFAAIVFGTVLLYEWYRKVGIDISITFENVEGLVPRQGKVLYKGAQIGTIEQIDLDENNNPVVKARISKSAKKLLSKNSEFWIVRPELGIAEINNLSAITTGCYVAMNPEPGEFADKFVGLEYDPVDESLENGLKIVIRAGSVNGINISTPILYHGLQIGEVGHLGLAKDQKTVLITAYIDRKYSNIIRKSTKFYNIGGFHADIHLFGTSHIAMDSVATLIKGGISVITNNFSSALAKDGELYSLSQQESDD